MIKFDKKRITDWLQSVFSRNFLKTNNSITEDPVRLQDITVHLDEDEEFLTEELVRRVLEKFKDQITVRVVDGTWIFEAPELKLKYREPYPLVGVIYKGLVLPSITNGEIITTLTNHYYTHQGRIRELNEQRVIQERVDSINFIKESLQNLK